MKQVKKMFLTILLLSLVAVTGCGGTGDTDSEGSANLGMVSGTVVDAGGVPVEGATVVIGENSPHDMTDSNGNFTILDVPPGNHKLHVISDGFYTLSNGSVSVSDATELGNVQVKEVSDIDDAPVISDATAVINGNDIYVTATITEGENEDAIVDARAELSGYNTGSAMTADGDIYSATISIPDDAVGPYLSILIFAVDEEDMTSSEEITVVYDDDKGEGEFSLDTIAGNWSGTLRYHRPPHPDYRPAFAFGVFGVHDWTNASLNISNSDVTGQYAKPDLDLLIGGAADPIENKPFDGAVTLINKNKGFYKIELSVTDTNTNWRADIVMHGKLDSAGDPGNFTGKLHIKETDSSSGTPVVRHYRGRFHLKKGESWDLSDLSSAWILSDFFFAGDGSPSYEGRYIPPFQYNEAFEIDASGSVVSGGTNSMGLNITGGSFDITDPSLGTFEGSITTEDNATTYFYGIINIGKRHVKGVKKITLNSSNVYGHFWGPKYVLPNFSDSDFGSRRIGDYIVTSVFRGHIYRDADSQFYMFQLRIDSNGNVLGGYIDSPLKNPIYSGKVYFVDTITGRISGTIESRDYTIYVGESEVEQRNASMGVYKGRLVGDISFSNIGDLQVINYGRFFLHRLPQWYPLS